MTTQKDGTKMENELDKWAEELQQSILEKMGEIYSEVVMEHWRHPFNFKELEHPDGYAKIKGPCGDTMEIFLRVQDDGKIIEAAFLTDGCGTSIASGSVCVSVAQGKTLAEARSIDQKMLLDVMKGLPEEDQHCPLLAANTLHKAIVNAEETRRDSWKKNYPTV
jgi:nitrogen fixation NifU-like protein